MDLLVARYGEIGIKSNPVRSRMKSVLRQRVADRLKYEGAEINKVSEKNGRIYAYISEPERFTEAISEIPGVASVSSALEVEPKIESITGAFRKFDVGETFAIRVNTGNISLSSSELEERLGAMVLERTGAEVDLDNPDTVLEADIREDAAHIFSSRSEGPDGFPVGTGGDLAALISGGIDSPVAAQQAMNRGSDITPVYFYNRPIAAEDHLMRFKSSAGKLKRFNPSREWEAYVIDMKDINSELMNVERGRMVVHRRAMFRIAERIAEKDGLEGIVTGESMSQKSSQTAINLSVTSRAAERPVHRPLLTWNKNQITEKAREIGTLEDANIDSACRTMSPDHPATNFKPDKAVELEDELELEELEDKAFREKDVISL